MNHITISYADLKEYVDSLASDSPAAICITICEADEDCPASLCLHAGIDEFTASEDFIDAIDGNPYI